MTTFATQLREARLKAGLSQSQLAERAAVPIKTIHRLEQGRCDDPKLSTALALARALGITVDSLCEEGK